MITWDQSDLGSVAGWLCCVIGTPNEACLSLSSMPFSALRWFQVPSLCAPVYTECSSLPNSAPVLRRSLFHKQSCAYAKAKSKEPVLLFSLSLPSSVTAGATLKIAFKSQFTLHWSPLLREYQLLCCTRAFNQIVCKLVYFFHFTTK